MIQYKDVSSGLDMISHRNETDLSWRYALLE